MDAGKHSWYLFHLTLGLWWVGPWISQFNHLSPFIRLYGCHKFSCPDEFGLPLHFLEEQVLAWGIGGAVVAILLGILFWTCKKWEWTRSSGGDGRCGELSTISLTMALGFQVMVPRALVVSITRSSRNKQGRVGPALAKMTVVRPTISILVGCLHFFSAHCTTWSACNSRYGAHEGGSKTLKK